MYLCFFNFLTFLIISPIIIYIVFSLSKNVVYVINMTARNRLIFTLCNKIITPNTNNSAPEIIKLKVSVIFFDFLYRNFFDNNISHTLDPSKGYAGIKLNIPKHKLIFILLSINSHL